MNAAFPEGLGRPLSDLPREQMHERSLPSSVAAPDLLHTHIYINISIYFLIIHMYIYICTYVNGIVFTVGDESRQSAQAMGVRRSESCCFAACAAVPFGCSRTHSRARLHAPASAQPPPHADLTVSARCSVILAPPSSPNAVRHSRRHSCCHDAGRVGWYDPLMGAHISADVQ